MFAQNLARRIEPIQVRHSNVERNQIRIALIDLLHGLLSISRFGANFPPSMRLDDRANSLAHDLMIIGNQNTEVWHRLPLVVVPASASTSVESCSFAG